MSAIASPPCTPDSGREYARIRAALAPVKVRRPFVGVPSVTVGR